MIGPAGAERRRLPADQVEVAHPLEVAVVGDARCAVAEPELGAQIDIDLAAAIGGFASERLAFAPRVGGERPAPLRPDRSRLAERRGAIHP